ncbi:MAG: ribosomal protein S18-alanine N-acetyltransferase [Thiomicrorhabdus chilensis]|uniref:ribosomal protein S18-alanine N-acetyltransferase n=1 Tax=Thiomicrorhabdus chilensis TaxID=63656 RepID=UPI00299F1E80|nr:ribosomal protein S18-alanine N-acetyltransferase [Thiomicrorhabdus chilensis]MDX1346734.1 ribosomal protein S18-alanine N-acetyltransferase [Thiomicrorhabdus chilensis]
MTVFSYLRAMHEGDLNWVLDVEQQAYDFPWSKKGFENSLDQGLNYVFCDAEGNALGYVCVLTVLDEAHILNLCVAPKYQKQGVARMALNSLQSKLKESGFTLLLLEVRVSNQPAISLYESFGFNRDGVRVNYYRCQEWDEVSGELVEAKEDAVLMSRTL